MVTAEARIDQRLGGQCSVPIGRDTRLIKNRVALIPNQFASHFERLFNYRMIVAIAECLERHWAEEIARLDSAKRIVGILMFEQPAFGVAQSALTQPAQMMMFVATQNFVSPIERVSQRE